MANPEHINWLRKGVAYWNELRHRSYFSPDFSDVHFRTEFSLPFSGLSLEGVNLRDGNFENADLRGIGLRRAELQNARFHKTVLQSVDFKNANLWKADFSYADLTGADFTTAYLTGANFSGANLERADLRFAILEDVDLTYAQPWKSRLFSEPQEQRHLNFPREVKSIGDLIEKSSFLQDNYMRYPPNLFDDNIYSFYFRGERDSSWELRPSVMRPPGSPHGGGFRDKEGEMLLDLMSRRPGDFAGVKPALSQWVLAQHHGLKTRFLDVTRNPLVALFHACEPSSDQDAADNNDGVLHVFVVPKHLVKPFDSDSISIIANLAKLARPEQETLMGKHLARLAYILGHRRSLSYASVMDRLYLHIRQEKPYFEKRIDIKDLFQVFIVEPERSFERISVQSGAFLVSAFHERFERDEILKFNDRIPVYDYYRLSVPWESKEKILRELELLNVTREVLFPGLDEAAKAIVRRNT